MLLMAGPITATPALNQPGHGYEVGDTVTITTGNGARYC